MILTCPSCYARFAVADAMIPTGGRTVRCSRCAHAWHVERTSFSRDPEPAAAPLPTVAPPTPSVAEVTIPDFDHLEMPRPVRKFNHPGRRAEDRTRFKNPRPYQIAAPLLACCWLVLAFVAYSPRWSQLPVLSGIYQALGSLPTDGLVFADVSMARAQESGKTKFVLSGSIRNTAAQARVVPTVRVTLKDKQNNTIWGRDYPVNTELKAGAAYPFRIPNIETAFAKNVARIVVDIGNPMQLLVR